MRIKRISFAAVLLLYYHSPLFSQGEFLRRGESGFGVGSGFFVSTSNAATATSFSVSAGYSFLTILDINLSYAKGDPSSTTVIRPSASYYLSKQTLDKEGTKETVAITILLQRVSKATSQSEKNLGLGLAIFLAHDYSSNASFIFQPQFGFSVHPSYGERKKMVTTASAGMSIGIRSSTGHGVAITPAVGFQEGFVFFGCTIALVASTGPAVQ
jgi:hypothetical protein